MGDGLGRGDIRQFVAAAAAERAAGRGQHDAAQLLRRMRGGQADSVIDVLKPAYGKNPTDDEIRHAISGNLCRCTGYVNIVKAYQHAAQKMREGGA